MILLIAIPILMFVVSFSFPFTYWPEMLNWPWVMNLGWLPYKDFSIIFTPLAPFILLMTGKLIGFTPFNVHLTAAIFLCLTNLIIILISYRLTRNRFVTGIVGLLHIYLAIAFEANAFYPELIVAPLFLLTYYHQQKFLDKGNLRNLYLSGIFMGLAIIAKQSSAYVLPEFLVLIGYLFLFRRTPIRNILKFIFFFSLPTLVILFAFGLILIRLGILFEFYDWSIKFVSLLPLLGNEVGVSDWTFPSPRHIPLLLGFIVVSLILTIWKRNFHSVFLLSWIVFSSLFIFPRFAYNHLLSMLSFYLLLVSYVVTRAKSKLIYVSVVSLITVLLAFPIIKKTHIETRSYLEVDLVVIADWVKSKYPTSSLLVLNSQEQFYFLTNKPPAFKPWVEQLPWLTYYYDKKYFEGFKSNPPDIIIFQPYSDWEFQPSIMKIVKENYRKELDLSSEIQLLKRK